MILLVHCLTAVARPSVPAMPGSSLPKILLNNHQFITPTHDRKRAPDLRPLAWFLLGFESQSARQADVQWET